MPQRSYYCHSGAPGLTLPLEGRRVALLDARLFDAAASTVRAFGGIPVCVPAVRQQVHLEHVAPLADSLSSGRISVVVFMTGLGAAALLDEAARLGRLDETLAALRALTVVCRGPKPSAVLRRYKVPVGIAAPEPYTTRELLQAMADLDVRERGVALLQHGERSGALAAALSARGALLEEWSLYEWALPDDLAPLSAMVRDLVSGRFEAIVFTNRIQCRHLFRVASDLGLAGPLADALNNDVIVAAVGPVCAEALQAAGVVADVIPARPNVESMIGALAEYFDLTHERTGESALFDPTDRDES